MLVYIEAPLPMAKCHGRRKHQWDPITQYSWMRSLGTASRCHCQTHLAHTPHAAPCCHVLCVHKYIALHYIKYGEYYFNACVLLCSMYFNGSCINLLWPWSGSSLTSIATSSDTSSIWFSQRHVWHRMVSIISICTIFVWYTHMKYM